MNSSSITWSRWRQARRCSGPAIPRCTMSDQARTLGEIAQVVRSKNAGPFWITLDVFFRNDAAFAHVRDANVLTAEKIGELYGVDAALVKRFTLPPPKPLKFPIPRPLV